MKTEELTALGLTKEQADAVFVMAGKDNAALLKKVGKLEDDFGAMKTRAETAEITLKGFEGIDPEKIKGEVETWKQKAETAEKDYTAKLTARDQRDWVNGQLDKYGVKSPYARRQLAADAMDAESGLKWKDGSFFGFDDYMKAAKEKDAGLYQTAEEKAAAEKAAAEKAAAPTFTGPTGKPAGEGKEPYIPPKII